MPASDETLASTTQAPLSVAQIDARPSAASWAKFTVAGILALEGACLAFAIFLLIDTIRTILRLHSPLPYFDEWDSLTLYSGLRSGASWWHLFDQHNEHRIFFPRLILFSDYLWFQGRGNLNIVTIFLLQIGQLAMLVGLLWAGRPKFGRIALAALVLVLLSSLRQEENFIWGFQVQFVGAYAVATFGFICFSRAVYRWRRGESFRLALGASLAAIGIATFSLASGMLSGIVLVILALLARARAAVTLATAGLTLLLAALYLHGYEPNPDHTALSEALSHPLRLAFYFLAYIGNFLDPDLVPAALLGACGTLATLVIAVRFATRRDDNPIRLALLGIMLFTLATAFVTALGRVGFGVEQAMASRYATVSAIFWSALSIAVWSIAERAQAKALLRCGVAAFAAILLAGAWRAQADNKPGMEERAFALQQSSNALWLGLKDAAAFEGVYDQPDRVTDRAPFLRQEHISIFSEPEAEWPGAPLSLAGTIGDDPKACTGSFDGATSDPSLGPNGVRVAGHGFLVKRSHVVSRIVIVDPGDHIVGLASGGIRHDDGDGWTGYAVAAHNVALRAFARASDGKLCELGRLDVTGSP